MKDSIKQSCSQIEIIDKIQTAYYSSPQKVLSQLSYLNVLLSERSEVAGYYLRAEFSEKERDYYSQLIEFYNEKISQLLGL